MQTELGPEYCQAIWRTKSRPVCPVQREVWELDRSDLFYITVWSYVRDSAGCVIHGGIPM